MEAMPPEPEGDLSSSLRLGDGLAKRMWAERALPKPDPQKLPRDLPHLPSFPVCRCPRASWGMPRSLNGL